MAVHAVGYATTVGASSTTGNILQGTLIERAPGPGKYTVWGRHAASAGTIVMDVYRGLEILGRSVPMSAAAGAPNVNDDKLLEFGVAGGETIVVILRETAGTNTIPNIKVEFRS